ncbi:MAG: hypothetical protein ACTSSA_12625 [Candidatus Freyarchaeota archaeon]
MKTLLSIWLPMLTGVVLLALAENRRWEAVGIAVSGTGVTLALAKE